MKDLAFAERYLRWWAPVLAPAALRLLDLVADTLAARAHPVIADVGTGTGTLATVAAARWQGVRVVGVDPDPGMLTVARSMADRKLGAAGRPKFLSGRAEALPLPDGSVDALVSSFAFQYVDGPAAFREAARVLRPGGVAAIVTWQGPAPAFPLRDVFSETLAECGLRESERDQRGLRSPSAAVAELERSGLVEVRAQVGPLGYRFEPDAFLEWKQHFGERQLFQGLDRPRRERLLALLRSRLAELCPDDFVVPDPIVYITGRRR